MVLYAFWSFFDKRNLKFVMNVPLNIAQGSHDVVPMGRNYRIIAKGSHAAAYSGVGDRNTR